MASKTTQKSYYLPKILMEYFNNWCKPGRDYSPKIAGAVLFYMLLKPEVREAAEIAAYSEDIEKAIKALRDNLPRDLIKIPPEDAHLYNKDEQYLSADKKAFRQYMINTLKELGVKMPKLKYADTGIDDIFGKDRPDAGEADENASGLRSAARKRNPRRHKEDTG